MSDTVSSNLSRRAFGLRYKGVSLDEALEKAGQNGYGCHVVYNDCPVVEPRSPRELVLHVDQRTNLVTKIR